MMMILFSFVRSMYCESSFCHARVLVSKLLLEIILPDFPSKTTTLCPKPLGEYSLLLTLIDDVARLQLFLTTFPFLCKARVLFICSLSTFIDTGLYIFSFSLPKVPTMLFFPPTFFPRFSKMVLKLNQKAIQDVNPIPNW